MLIKVARYDIIKHVIRYYGWSEVVVTIWVNIQVIVLYGSQMHNFKAYKMKLKTVGV